MGLLDSASAQPSLGINSTTGMPQFSGFMDFLKSPQAMALAQGLLQAGAPSRIPITLGQGLAQGMQNMQEATQNQQAYAMNQQKLASNDLELKQQKADALANAMGSVYFSKPDQKAAAYRTALNSAGKLGLDTSQWPQKYDSSTVDPMVETALTQSLGAKNLFANQIEMMKAQAQLALAGANLDVKRQDVNTKATLGGLPAPYGAGGSGIAGMMAPSAMPISNGSVAPNQPITQQPQANVVQQKQAPNAASPALSFPAQIAGQKKQAEDWEAFKDSTAKGASNYQDLNNLINQARSDVGGSIIQTSPLTGWARQYTIQGDKLNKDSNKLQTEITQQMSQSGISRMDIPIIKAIKESIPSNDRYTETNQTILDKYQAANELSGNIMPQIIQRLDQMGVRDRNQAQTVANKVVTATGAFKPDGSIDLKALQNWQPIFDQIVSGKQPQTTNTSANSASMDLEAQAAEAIRRGADPGAVRQRLQSLRSR